MNRSRVYVRGGGMILFVSLLSLCLGGCTGPEASAEGVNSESQKPSAGSLVNKVKRAFVEPKYEVATGTPLAVRLNHSISSESNAAGDEFTATLDESLNSEGRTLAPEGSQVIGRLTEVQDAGKMKGRARMTLVLHTLEVGNKSYSIETRPISFKAKATKKKDATKIGAGAGVGALIGALAGGKKGAAIGAGVGAGAGTGVVLATKGEKVAFGGETQFSFKLAEPVKLPVVKETT